MKREKSRTATIYDIASKAQVSPATVSKVLNNKGSISGDTQKRIMEIAEQLHYIPNPAARYLKTKKTNQIMLAIPNVRDLFFLDMIQVVQNTCQKHDYSLLINSSDDSEHEELKMLDNLGNNFIDGLILVSVNYTQMHLDRIKRIKRPVVLCSIGCEALNEFEPLSDFVGVDSRKGIYLATKHLIAQGHTQIGFVGLDVNNQTGNERYHGFLSAMNESHIPIHEEYVKTGGADEIFGNQVGMEYSVMKNSPTAICASADQIVIGLYKAFNKSNILIPDDIAIIGMDDTYIDEVIKPKLSSVNLSPSEIGKSAINLLLQRIEGDDSSMKSVIYQPKLVIRESSKRAL